MRVVLVVPFTPDVTMAPSAAMTVANEFNAAGWVVRLAQGDEATRAGLSRAVGGESYDLVWLWMHSGAAGFKLNDGEMMSPAEMGQFLSMAGATDAVINSCFSIEHIETLQRAANVNVVATIDPRGLPETTAWTTATYLAKAFISTGDLHEACRMASANGLVQYRYIPAGGLRMSPPNNRGNEDIRETVQQLVTAIQGNTFTRTPGMLDELRQMATKLDAYMREDAAWKARFEDRLTTLEAKRPAEMSPRTLLFTLLLVLASSALVLLVIGRLSGGA